MTIRDKNGREIRPGMAEVVGMGAQRITGWSTAFEKNGVVCMITVQAETADKAASMISRIVSIPIDDELVGRTYTTHRELIGDFEELLLSECKGLDG